jgi:hypothetical protein
VPVGLVRLDDSLIAFVPAEATVHAGRLMRHAVLRAGTDAKYAFLGGLSNGYILYVTSETEYQWHGVGGGCLLSKDNRDRQSYEAASNLYGPHVARYLADSLVSLAAAMQGARVEGVDRADAIPYATGPVRSRLATPHEVPVSFSRSALTTCSIPGIRAVCFRWEDGPVGDVAMGAAPWIALFSDGDTAVDGPLGPIDDRGFDFVTRIGNADDARSDWSTLFVVDASEEATLGRERRLAIRVRGAKPGTDVQSSWFTLGTLPRPCTQQEVAACGDCNNPVGPVPYCKGWDGRASCRPAP